FRDLKSVIMHHGGAAAVVGQPAQGAELDAELCRQFRAVADDRQAALGEQFGVGVGVLQAAADAGAGVGDGGGAEGGVFLAALLLFSGAFLLVLGAALLALLPAPLALRRQGLVRVLDDRVGLAQLGHLLLDGVALGGLLGRVLRQPLAAPEAVQAHALQEHL